MRRRPAVQQAFDEARFGATRILNVREPMLSAAEATRRAEGWLRAKQVEAAGEVLIITGRGKGSPDQVGVVREAVAKLLGRLRRSGVVAVTVEHTPGSFAVTLAPLRALFEAPPRHRDGQHGAPRTADAPNPGSLAGLEPDTLNLLRRLATHSLDSLGMGAMASRFVEAEMERKFALLTRGGRHVHSEAELRAAIERALAEFEEA